MNNRKLKVLLLSLMMAIGLMLPSTGHAQNDQFFKNGEDLYNNRDATTGNITNQTFGLDPSNSVIGGITNPTFGQDPATGVTGGITNQQFGAPLGSGLLIMMMAGMGYAVAKNKRKE